MSANRDILDDSSDSAIYGTDGFIHLEKWGITVENFSLKLSGINKMNSNFITSSPVVKADKFIAYTCDKNVYFLEEISRNLPPAIINEFKSGFPQNWKHIVEKFSNINKTSTPNKQDNTNNLMRNAFDKTVTRKDILDDTYYATPIKKSITEEDIDLTPTNKNKMSTQEYQDSSADNTLTNNLTNIFWDENSSLEETKFLSHPKSQTVQSTGQLIFPDEKSKGKKNKVTKITSKDKGDLNVPQMDNVKGGESISDKSFRKLDFLEDSFQTPIKYYVNMYEENIHKNTPEIKHRSILEVSLHGKTNQNKGDLTHQNMATQSTFSSTINEPNGEVMEPSGPKSQNIKRAERSTRKKNISKNKRTNKKIKGNEKELQDFTNPTVEDLKIENAIKVIENKPTLCENKNKIEGLDDKNLKGNSVKTKKRRNLRKTQIKEHNKLLNVTKKMFSLQQSAQSESIIYKNNQSICRNDAIVITKKLVVELHHLTKKQLELYLNDQENDASNNDSNPVKPDSITEKVRNATPIKTTIPRKSLRNKSKTGDVNNKHKTTKQLKKNVQENKKKAKDNTDRVKKIKPVSKPKIKQNKKAAPKKEKKPLKSVKTCKTNEAPIEITGNKGTLKRRQTVHVARTRINQKNKNKNDFFSDAQNLPSGYQNLMDNVPNNSLTTNDNPLTPHTRYFNKFNTSMPVTPAWFKIPETESESFLSDAKTPPSKYSEKDHEKQLLIGDKVIVRMQREENARNKNNKRKKPLIPGPTKKRKKSIRIPYDLLKSDISYVGAGSENDDSYFEEI